MVETWLPDCEVRHQVRIDHLSRLPVMPPSTLMSTGCKSSHNRCQSQQWWAKNIRLDWPTVMSDDFLHQLVQPSFVGLAVQCWRALEAMGDVQKKGTIDKAHGRVILLQQILALLIQTRSLRWDRGMEWRAAFCIAPQKCWYDSDYWREQFQTISENVSVCNVLMHSAHQRFHDDALYKSTFYLLIYLLTWITLRCRLQSNTVKSVYVSTITQQHTSVAHYKYTMYTYYIQTHAHTQTGICSAETNLISAFTSPNFAGFFGESKICRIVKLNGSSFEF